MVVYWADSNKLTQDRCKELIYIYSVIGPIVEKHDGLRFINVKGKTRKLLIDS